MIQQKIIKGAPAPDGIHDKIEFNEWRNPSYWMWIRARRAFWQHLVPVGIVVLFLLTCLLTGYIEVCF